MLTRISVSKVLSRLSLKISRLFFYEAARALMCALKHVLAVWLATQFTINFLYLDVWLWRDVSSTTLGQLSVSFIPSGRLNNIFQSHVGFGARVLAFSLEKPPTLFLKIPLFMLIYCSVCVLRVGM